MNTRFRALAVGAAVVAVYVAAAAATASLGAIHGRPLLDSFVPPAPYRWVSPPPALAAGNQPPHSGAFSVPLGATGSPARALSTPDLQATLILEPGAFPPESGQDQVRLSIEPLDPATLGPPPAGVTIVGNAYRFRAVYVPGGQAVTRLGGAARVILAYPATAGVYRHRTLQSATGTGWRSLTTTDTGVQLQTISDVRSLGLFAVGQVGKPSSGSLARSLPAIILTVLALGVSAWFGVTAIRDRLRRGRSTGRSS